MSDWQADDKNWPDEPRDMTPAEERAAEAAEARRTIELDWYASSEMHAVCADIDRSPWLSVEHGHDSVEVVQMDATGDSWCVVCVERGTESHDEALATLRKLASHEPLGAAA